VNKISDLERRNAWLSFASAALAGLGSDSKYELGQLEEDATDVADNMLDEYLSRFEPGHEPEAEPEPPKRPSRRR
jgi:hypothetical protein